MNVKHLVLVCCSAMLAACTGPTAAPSSDEPGPLGKADITGADDLKQRPDGTFDVTCKNGQTEVATAAQILANKICLVATTSARPNGVLDVTCADGSHEVDSPQQLADHLACVKARLATVSFYNLQDNHSEVGLYSSTSYPDHRANVELKVIDSPSGSKLSAVFYDLEDVISGHLTAALGDVATDGSFTVGGNREDQRVEGPPYVQITDDYTLVIAGTISGQTVTVTQLDATRTGYSASRDATGAFGPPIRLSSDSYFSTRTAEATLASN